MATIKLIIGRNIGDAVDALSSETIAQAACKAFCTNGCTCYETRGLWCGQWENGLAVELGGLEMTREQIERKTAALAATLRQESIYLIHYREQHTAVCVEAETDETVAAN